MESEHLGKPLLQPNFDKYWRGLSSTRVKAGEAEPRDLTDWFGCSRKYDTQRREKWYVGTIVVALEKVVHKLRGGNTRFNGGLFRYTYAGLDDLMALIRGLGDVRVDPYSAQDFRDDIARVTGGHATDRHAALDGQPRGGVGVQSRRRSGASPDANIPRGNIEKSVPTPATPCAESACV